MFGRGLTAHTVQSGIRAFEVDNSPSLIGQLSGRSVASECYRRRGFGMIYKKHLGLALMPLAYLCVEVYVQRLVERVKLF